MKRAICYSISFMLIFLVGCQRKPVNITNYNGTYQHYGPFAVDQYGFYNCTQKQEGGSLVISEKVNETGKVLVPSQNIAISMINPTPEVVYFVRGENEICAYWRDSGEVEVLSQMNQSISYLRHVDHKLYYTSDFHLYSYDLASRETKKLYEYVLSADFYQNRIYVSVMPKKQGELQEKATIASMDLDGTNVKKEAEVESLFVDKLNVSDEGIFFMTLGKELKIVKDGKEEPFSEVKETFQYALCEEWIYYLDLKKENINRIKTNGSGKETVANGKNIYLFYIVGNQVIYFDQDQKMKYKALK